MAPAPPPQPSPVQQPPRPKRHLWGSKSSLEFDHNDTQTLDHQIHDWVDSTRPRLGEVLLDLGSVDPEDLLDALQRQRETPDDAEARARLGEILLELGKIDEVALAAALANQFGVPLADLRDATVSPEAVARVPEELARKHGVLPLKVEGARVFLASADPLDTAAIEELTRFCHSIGLLIGPRSDIQRLIDQCYNPLHTADDVIRAFELSDSTPDVTDADSSFKVDENAPVVQVVNRILTQGVRSRASDIHVEPAEDHLRVRYRVDGAMNEAIRLPVRMGPALLSRIKVMSELNIVERRRPQDGQFSVRVDGRPIDIRCSVVPTIHGEKAVMRLLDKTKSLLSMTDLGMIPAVEGPFLKLAKAPLGMILCTGPTGSGKTTTLYAALTEVNDPTKNVITIEDPVEYQFEGISQMSVSDTGVGFADGLRGILRQDPDVILVGEVRDEETARIAMQAALTGHLVLSSLHAIDAVSALHRFTDMGIEPFLIASAINGVVAQRLVRRLCNVCKEPTTPTSREINAVSEHTDGQMPEEWYRAKGCNLCNGSGFRGRIGVYELLELSEGIRELIVSRATEAEIARMAISEGMRTMQEQAFMLVVDGITTVDEVLRSVYAPSVEEHAEPLALGPGKRQLPRGKDALPAGDGEQESVDLVQDGAVVDVRPVPLGPVNGRMGAPAVDQPADVEATA